jgi:hypothetical protein
MPRDYLRETTQLLSHAEAMLGDTVSSSKSIFEEVKRAHRLLSTAPAIARTDYDWRNADAYYRQHADPILTELMDMDISSAGDPRWIVPLEPNLPYDRVMR